MPHLKFPTGPVRHAARVRAPRADSTAARALAILLAAATLSQAQSPQQAPQQQQPAPQDDSSSTFTLKAYSRLTVVDVIVYDNKDNPVRGIPQSAFTVLEDGKPQPIKSFVEYSSLAPVPPRPLPKLPPHIYTNLQPPPTTDAVNILLLDSLNTGLQDQIFLKDEAVKFLKTMPPGTRLAVMGLSSHLRLLQGFTSDPAILMAAVNTKKNRSLPSPFIDDASADATDQLLDMADADAAASIQEFQNQQTAFQNDMRTRMTLEALNQIAAYLSGIKGRKNLIWFTAGTPLQMFPQGGINDLATMTDYTKDVRRTTDLLTSAQIAVYPVDVAGVQTNPSASVVKAPAGAFNGRGDAMGKAIAAFDTKTANEHLGMDAVAEATGGIAFYNTNNLKEAVSKAVNTGENYYAISYVPPDPNFDGQFHKISVKLSIPNTHLSYRKGYYADDIARNETATGVSLSTTAPEPYGNNMAASMGRGVPTSSQLLFTARVEPHSDAVNPPGTKVLGVLDPKLANKTLRRYDFQYALPGRQLVFKDGPNKTHKDTLEFDIAAYDVYGKLITSLSQSIDLTLTDDRYQMLQRKPFELLQGIDLPLGEVFVRIGILDANADKTGTMEIPLDVTSKPESRPAAATPPAQK